MSDVLERGKKNCFIFRIFGDHVELDIMFLGMLNTGAYAVSKVQIELVL